MSRARVASLLSAGKTRDALDLAKYLFKTAPSADAEALVLDAYEAHIRALLARKMYPEARHLASTVIERFCGSRNRFAPLARQAEVAATGDIQSLLAELASAEGARRRELEAMLARELRDPKAVAESSVLQVDDPLRQAASIVSTLFTAATTGPVARDALTPLSAIPRHSPLAPWTLLIRAIAAFYRREDAAALANLSALPVDSGPAPLAAALRSLVSDVAADEDRERAQAIGGLLEQVSGAVARARPHLVRLARALEVQDASRASAAFQDLLPCLRLSPPGLRQTALSTILHHWSRARLNPRPLVRALLRHESDTDALRFVALTLERHGDWRDALLAWDRYLDTAVRSGSLPAAGPEVARVLLRMAELFPSDPDDVLDEFGVDSEEAIREAVQRGRLPKCVDRGRLLERARAADPFPGVFRALVEHYAKRDPRRAEAHAEAWHQSHPHDLEPLLYLIRSAERRGALRKALRLLEVAETIDPVHVDVRRSRFRLLLAGAERRIKDGKAGLAERDLERLAREPAFGEGDTAAYVMGLKWAAARRGANAAGAAEIERALAVRTGNPTLTHLVLAGIAASLGVEPPAPPGQAASQDQAVDALARACELFRKLDRPFQPPAELAARVEQDLSAAPLAQLHALCAGGLAMGRPSLAYAASGEGLARGGGALHRFLLIRGRALRMARAHREYRDRARQCFRAARALAARVRDMDIVREASAALAQVASEENPFGFDGPSQSEVPPTEEEITRVVVVERSRRDVPRFAAAGPDRARPRVPRQQRLFEDFLAFLEQTL